MSKFNLKLNRLQKMGIIFLAIGVPLFLTGVPTVTPTILRQTAYSTLIPSLAIIGIIFISTGTFFAIAGKAFVHFLTGKEDF